MVNVLCQNFHFCSVHVRLLSPPLDPRGEILNPTFLCEIGLILVKFQYAMKFMHRISVVIHLPNQTNYCSGKMIILLFVGWYSYSR
jgi:hypothetical protein